MKGLPRYAPSFDGKMMRAEDGRWLNRDDVLDTVRLAAEARTTVGGIDVERLARALTEHFGPSYFPGLHDVTVIGESPTVIAERIAAEYDALAAAPPADAGERAALASEPVPET